MSLAQRIKKDYFMKNRFHEYRNFLEKALGRGYEFIKMCDYYEGLEKTKKIVVLRHDIDTDVKIARKMFKIEKELNIKSSYYFRLKTANKKLINELKEFGCEVSYHFEEISTFAYKKNLYTKEDIFKNLPTIQEKFKKNLNDFKNKYLVSCETIASHGDFVNRKLKIVNFELLTSQIREESNIKFEAYDTALMSNSKYCSDGNSKFLQSLTFDDSDFYYMLVHPRTWDSAFFVRLYWDTRRLFAGLKYSLCTKLKKGKDLLVWMNSLPKEKINIIGEVNQSVYKYFNQRHKKCFFIKNKTIGVCLLTKPNTFDEYLIGKDKQTVRTRRNKCARLNYTLSEFKVADYVEDIMEINSSKEERQGRQMSKDYLDVSKIVQPKAGIDVFGVFNEENKLLAYCYMQNVGDAVVVSRLLGHAEYLNDGVMHFMISECIKMWPENKKWQNCKFFLYDMWYGASKGLKTFKADLGFRPYKVKYKYKKENK